MASFVKTARRFVMGFGVSVRGSQGHSRPEAGGTYREGVEDIVSPGERQLHSCHRRAAMDLVHSNDMQNLVYSISHCQHCNRDSTVQYHAMPAS